PAVAAGAGADRRVGPTVRAGSEDCATVCAGSDVAPLPEAGVDDDPAGDVRGGAAGPGAPGPLLGPDPVPGAGPAGLHGQLPDGEALRAAPAPGAAASRRDADALRDAAGAAEPDRLGHRHGARGAAVARAARLRAHAGL